MKTTTETKHTPTPWHRQHESNDIRAEDERNITTVSWGDDCDRAEADAAFIVRAVNAHDRLLEALRLAHSRLNGANRSDEDDAACREIEEALAQAEGGAR